MKLKVLASYMSDTRQRQKQSPFVFCRVRVRAACFEIAGTKKQQGK